MIRRLPRPVPRTPLQRALAHFAAALRLAATDERTHAAFVEVAIPRLAADAAERLDAEKRS